MQLVYAAVSWGKGVRPTGLFCHVHLGYVDPHVLPPVCKILPHRLELLARRAPGSVAEGCQVSHVSPQTKLHKHRH